MAKKVETNNIDEGTAALASVATKSQDLGGIIAKIDGKTGETVNKFKATQDQVGHEADTLPDRSASNRATVAAKKVTKEDMDTIFGDSEITEEIRDATFTLFEAAVTAKVLEYENGLNERYEEALEEAIAELDASYAEQINEYLEHVATKWLEENQVAVEKSLKAEISEDFINGLKQLFIEHNIEIPEDAVDVVEELSARNDELTAKLDEATNELIELKSTISEARKEVAFDDVAEGLVATQKEKLRTLAEGVEFTTDEEYMKKVTLIKEAHFSDKGVKKDTGLLVEEVPAIDPDSVAAKEVINDPQMSAYASAISRTVKSL